MNHYLTLGISPDAGEETVRHAFRELARRYHPDAGPGSSAETFRRVVEAYEVLRDPVRRAAYDASLRAARRRGSRGRVEPLRAEPLRAEPLRPRTQPRFSQQVFFDTDPIQELFNEMFRMFEDDFFGGIQFRW